MAQGGQRGLLLVQQRQLVRLIAKTTMRQAGRTSAMANEVSISVMFAVIVLARRERTPNFAHYG